jgi:hypothetical protein
VAVALLHYSPQSSARPCAALFDRRLQVFQGFGANAMLKAEVHLGNVV